jgi:hypothetical protein
LIETSISGVLALMKHGSTDVATGVPIRSTTCGDISASSTTCAAGSADPDAGENNAPTNPTTNAPDPSRPALIRSPHPCHAPHALLVSAEAYSTSQRSGNNIVGQRV